MLGNEKCLKVFLSSRYSRKEELRGIAEKIKALGHEIDHTIPDDPAMRLAADAGRPLNEVRGGSSLEKRIRSMVHAIARKANVSHVEPRRA